MESETMGDRIMIRGKSYDVALIEAAPELLECCVAALVYMGDDSRSARRRAANMEGLREIIAKAKGTEQPAV